MQASRVAAIVGFWLAMAAASSLPASPAGREIRIVGPTGEPVRGATGAASPADGGGGLRELETANGTAFLAPPGRYLLTVRAVGFIPWVQEVAAPGLPLTVELRRAAGVVGVVRNDEGEPVPGVKLTVQLVEGGAASSVLYSDAKGRFWLEDIEPGLYALRAEAEGHIAWSRDDLLLTSGYVERADFRMHREARVQVFVQGPEGRPLEGVEVSAAEASGGAGLRPEERERLSGLEARTGKEGYAHLGPLSRGLPVRVVLRHPGYAPASVEVTPRGELAWQEATLGVGGTLRVAAMAQGGRPVEGATIRLRPVAAPDGDLAPEPPPADRAGRVVLEHLPLGTYAVSVRAEGYRAVAIPAARIREGRNTDFSVEILRTEPVSGWVLSEEGGSVPGARVTAVFFDGGERMEESVTTDGQGAFRFETLPAGRVDLWVEARGFFPAEAPDVPTGSTALQIRLSPGADPGPEGGEPMDGEGAPGGHTPRPPR